MCANFQEYTVDEFLHDGWLTSSLEQVTGENIIVVNQTNLGGKYDFRVRFDATAAAVPAIFKALEQQLGLRLVRTKATRIDILVIDHAAEVPSSN